MTHALYGPGRRPSPALPLVALASALGCASASSPEGGGSPGTDLGATDPVGRDAGAPDAEAADTSAPDAAPADAAALDGGDLAAWRERVLAARWTALPDAPRISGKQDDLFFIDPMQGLSVNGQGRIFLTLDGGARWETLVERPGTFFRSILMLGPTRGFAGNIGPGYFPGVTDPVPLYETRDGRTFSPVTSVSGDPVTGICNMFQLDARHLFAVGRVGGPSVFVRSDDAGETWTARALDAELDMLIDVRFTSPERGIVVGQDRSARCAVLGTTDGGRSWSPVFQSEVPGTLCWKLSFPSPEVGYLSIQGGARSTFAKTTDGGATWTEKPLLPGRAFRGLGAGFITEEIGWMANESGAWRTTDGGETWAQDPSLGPAINRFRFVDHHTGYAIGTTIYKLEVPHE